MKAGAAAGRLAVRVEPLTPERSPDVATLFEEGGDPKWCWCAWFRVAGRDFSNATAADNRRTLERATGAAAAEGRAPGLIAYADGRAVGWVSLGPRSDFGRIERSRLLAPIDDRPVWSIVCFVVSRTVRGRGVAEALLGAAITYARHHGATLLEAYPVDTSGGRIPSASAFRGTLSMFERAGFGVVAVRRANRASPPRPIVRRAVGGPEGPNP